MDAKPSIASEFDFHTDAMGIVVFTHEHCNYALKSEYICNLQEVLTTLFDHARECEKERNPKPKKRKPPHGAW